MKHTVLVVGASGCVGQSAVQELLRRGLRVRAAAQQPDNIPANAEFVQLADLTQPVGSWDELLEGVDQIVYLAAYAPAEKGTSLAVISGYRVVNKDAAVSLAQAATLKGIRRSVYLSAVNGHGEPSRRPLTELDHLRPVNPYNLNTHQAEVELLQLGRQTELEVVVLRPAMIYGPNATVSLMTVLRAAGHGWPLPVGALRYRRSLIYVENLANLIAVVLEHPAAPGELFYAADDEDLSMADLTRRIAEIQGRRPWLPAVPVPILRLLGRAVGHTNTGDWLTSSLRVSSSKAQTLLDWTPPYPVWQAIARTGRGLPPPEMTIRPAPKPYSLTTGQRLYLALRLVIERVAAVVLLAVLSPLFCLLAVLIRRDSPGSALFLQDRAGRHHLPFRIYKFRTMRSDAPNLSTEDMQRSGLNPITRLGAFLRRTSLDELPQLLNVVKGEMSFIGPRPALLTQTPVLDLRKRAGVEQLLPGITGYAQATGRDDLDDVEKVERDAYYLKHLSPRLDLKLLSLTLDAVMKGTGTK